MQAFRSVLTRLVLALAAGGLPAAALAMQELPDEALSTLDAQDGLRTWLQYNTMNLNQAVWDLDRPSVTFPGYDAYFLLNSGYLTGVSLDGATTNLPATVNLSVDAGATSQTTVPTVLVDVSWSMARLGVNALCLGVRDGSGNLAACTPGTSASFGRMALDTAVSARLHGLTGLFNQQAGGMGRFVLSNAKAFFRQQTSELIWKDVNFDIGYANGGLGGDAAGLRVLANRFDWNINYNIAYKGTAATPFQTTGSTSMLQYGWSGGLRDFEARISPGGIWVGSEANRTEGIKISWRNNFDTDFAWIIGDPTDSAQPRVWLHFTDWVNLPGALYTFDVPNVTLDVVRANQGPGSISYRGTNYNLQPGSTAMAVAVRDLKFLGHNTKVTLYDQSPVVAGGPYPRTINWGLIYTFGDMDANIFLYPGGRTAALPEGFRLDADIAVQSPTTWQGNTHFMIADTDPGKNVGFGFLNTDFLIQLRNTFVELNSEGIRLAALPDADPGTPGIQSPGDFRWQLKTTFGGGYMNNLGVGSLIEGFGLDLNLHASKLDVTFMPPPSGSTYILFKWDAVLLNDSYIRISEPAKPTVAWNFNSLSGALGVRNGKIDLSAAGESADLQPRLKFEQELLAGRTAISAAGGTPVAADALITQMGVGTNNIARLAVPGGNWYGGLALKQQ